MFSSDRRNTIKNLINETKRVDVSELSKQFDVSEVTIRKDLAYLEKAGILIRTYGGAVSPEIYPTASEQSQPVSVVDEPDSSRSIAQTIFSIISDNDLIYLGTDKLCVEIAKKLAEKEFLSVLTNNVSAAIELSRNPQLSITMPPGNLTTHKGIQILTGSETLAFLSRMYVDKSILCPEAVNFNRGFCMQDSDLARCNSIMLDNSDCKIYAAPHDRFGRNALMPFATLEHADKVIGDEKLPEEYIRFFYDHQIQVYTSYDF